MAVIKTITIKFDILNNLQTDENLSLGIQTNSGLVTFTEIFRFIRSGNGLIQIGVDSIDSAYNANTAFNLDGTLLGLNSSLNVDEITLSLSNQSYYFTTIEGTAIDNGRVTYTTSTSEPVVENIVEIDSYTAKNPFCTDINAIINAQGGSGSYDVYVDNVLSLSSQTSPITVPLKRGEINNLRIISGIELIGVVESYNPRKLIEGDITTEVTNLSTGSNINISVKYISPYVSPYTYSLDSITYQSSNIYTGLAPNTYNLYVKDNLGCVTIKEVVVDGITSVTDTVFSISDINPFRFFKYETGKKNYKNTLSCNDLRLMPFQYNQSYLESDIITTQFKTNAGYINVFTIDEDLNTHTLSAVKRTNNMGLSAKSTSTYFDLGDGKSGLYFGVVDILNPITDEVLKSEDYGFTLPQWANTVGNYVTIEGIGQVPIDEITYSDFYKSFVLQFNISYTGSAVTKKVYSEYNLQPYEIYEFLTTMSVEFINFNVVIEVGTNEDNINYTYISEKVQRVNDNEFLFDIDYWDEKNIGGMVYQTGIRNKIRLKGNVSYVGEQKTEGYDGDTKYYVTDNTVYHSERFSFYRVSSEIAQKLRLVFAHKYLYINGIEYQLSEPPEIPQSEGNSNIKNFFVTLKSNGNQLLEESQEQIVGTTGSLEIQSLITAIQGKGGLLWTKNNG